MDIKKVVVDTFEVVAEPTTSIVSSMFLEGLAGSVVPGAVSAMLSYKQKRAEKNLEKFMVETKRRQDEFEEKLKKLSPELLSEVSEKYFGQITDYVINEVQQEKIKFMVNGFINLCDLERMQEDLILLYYDTLEQLNLLDIRVFKLYGFNNIINPEDSTQKICNEMKIDFEQIKLIRSKLERCGLLETKYEKDYESLYKNVDNITKYIQELEKGKKAKLKVGKLHSNFSNSYVITKFGQAFLAFFIE